MSVHFKFKKIEREGGEGKSKIVENNIQGIMHGINDEVKNTKQVKMNLTNLLAQVTH